MGCKTVPQPSGLVRRLTRPEGWGTVTPPTTCGLSTVYIIVLTSVSSDSVGAGVWPGVAERCPGVAERWPGVADKWPGVAERGVGAPGGGGHIHNRLVMAFIMFSTTLGHLFTKNYYHI